MSAKVEIVTTRPGVLDHKIGVAEVGTRTTISEEMFSGRWMRKIEPEPEPEVDPEAWRGMELPALLVMADQMGLIVKPKTPRHIVVRMIEKGIDERDDTPDDEGDEGDEDATPDDEGDEDTASDDAGEAPTE